MTVEIINVKFETKETQCHACKSTLSYVPGDVDAQEWGGTPRKRLIMEYIMCPKCESRVTVGVSHD